MASSTEERAPRRKPPVAVALGFAMSATMVALISFALAPMVGVVFAVGFFGGFFLWLARPMHASFRSIKVPYVLSLVAYAIHRTEEEIAEFVPAIEELTDATAADVASPLSVALVVASLIWLLSPLLIRRGNAFGYYGAWTVFMGFGILELAHFVFPVLSPEPYGYFPGMLTVPILAPIAWWGLWRLWRGDAADRTAAPRTPAPAADAR